MASRRTLAVSLLSLLAFQLPASADLEKGLLPPVLVKGEAPHMVTISEWMEDRHVPGVSIAFIQGGKIAWTQTYGVTRIGGPAVTPDTLFQAASISKPVAALAVLHLVQEGKLDLNKDVNTYLKSWKVPENDFTKEKKVTLRALLSHTGGMSVHGFAGYERDTQLPSLTQMLNGEPPANSAPIRVEALPGSGWKYSGGGYVVTRQLLEDMTGVPFPKLLQDLVLKPIGMTRSSYEQPLPPERLAEAATPYRVDGKEVAGGPHTYPEIAPDGLWTTPSDLARYAIEVQNSLTGKANHILSEAMTREMLKPVLQDWGLGPELGGKDPHHPLFQHGGANEGFRCDLVVYQQGEGVVVMTNGDNGGEIMGEIVRTLAYEHHWPDFQPMEREAATIGQTVAKRYAGYYRIGRYSLAEASLDQGALYLKLPGMEKHRLYPAAERDWFFSDMEADVSFDPDAKGQEPAMILRRFGDDTPGRRIAAARAKEIENELAAKIKTQTPDPAADAVLRRVIEELRKGEPDYDRMVPAIAKLTKDHLPELKATMEQFGAVKSIDFKGVAEDGADIYKVVCEHQETEWRLIVDLRGKIETIGF